MPAFLFPTLLALLPVLLSAQADPSLPHLRTRGETTQLIVDGEPYLVLGGELGNSSFTSLEYMAPIWPKLRAMHLNTVLAPVYWELVEPEEGKFDFTLLDQLIAEARAQDFKLVLLWFASWKNSMSSHAPAWVKRDQERFPRVQDDTGKSQEILTPFGENNRAADRQAFAVLMAHLRSIDSEDRTVIMVQPENEMGMLPTARDYHPLANARYRAPVPAELMDYLVAHREDLIPKLRERWALYGYRNAGTWEEVFGPGLPTEEIFMAWYFARYTEAVAAAGKAEYPLPLFVNAALPRPGRLPGQYPSAGPLPHLMDIWRAGAPSIDFLSPDFYNPDFKHWNDLYTRQGNPLFIPEHRFDNTVAAKAAYAIGHYEAIGFAPFSIESTDAPEDHPLGKMYGLLAQLEPLLTARHGQGQIDGVLLDKDNPEMELTLGDYVFTFRHSHTLGWEAAAGNAEWEMAGAVIVQTGANEFHIAGSGIVATFTHRTQPELNVGILKVDEGEFRDGGWTIVRHLNGDQTHQGRHVRIFKDDFAIQRLKLYTYE